VSDDKNMKHKQQDLTELNADGNRERGREGEDLTGAEEPTANSSTAMTEEEIAEQQFKDRLEQLRKRDPFIYR